MTTAPKKKRRARKSKKQYFGPEVDVAIIEYNATEDTEVKSRIYEREIRKPMEKLVENIIHTFKFYMRCSTKSFLFCVKSCVSLNLRKAAKRLVILV